MEHEEDEHSGESSLEKHDESMELDEDSASEESESSNADESKNSSTDVSMVNDSRNSTLVNNALSSEDLIKNSTWELGTLAWARMSIYPFWPCMITHDPNSPMIYQKVQTVGKSKTLMIHVHFFNDNGRHSWIPSHHMLHFDNGIEDFRKRASLVTDIIRKKEPKFAAALTIKPNIYGTWQKAVAEAMDVLYEIDMSPLENFKPRQKDSKTNASNNNGAIKKRKRKDDDTKSAKKHLKQTDSNDDSRLSTNILKYTTKEIFSP
ncbi:probable histone-lysine N-methyltransferase Mes-4 isoform X2 [Nasonia vitripennis]|uniref:PWWP domain-containing protein n=1 Tax=Nasonia vitripennis TaxID=7425 RepID=A0A7M7LLZ1_NASVI|nr:probable histone-lysine N-methyltransferase Mes-4 isoform X2 [Nasonia vitripennis]